MECEEIERTFPSSFRLVPHNVSGIPATLWLTMWTECEEFVSLNLDALCVSAWVTLLPSLTFLDLSSRVWYCTSLQTSIDGVVVCGLVVDWQFTEP